MLQRPLRVRTDVPLGSISPGHMNAGEIGTWILRVRIERRIKPGSALRLITSESRPIKLGISAQNWAPGSPNYVSASINGGEPLSPVLPSAFKPGAFQATFLTPEHGIEPGETLEIVMGDTRHGSRGIQAPCRAMEEAFILLRSIEHSSAEEDIAAFIFDVRGGAYSRLRAVCPSVADSDPIKIAVRPSDEYENVAGFGRPKRLTIWYEGQQETFDVPDDAVNYAGVIELPIVGMVPRAGEVRRFRIEDADSHLSCETNPVVNLPGVKLCWGVIHEHTEISDGMGSLDLCYRNMRYGSALDFGAVADHDHETETTDEMWVMTQEAAEKFNEPGKFSTFLSYEWAKWRKNGDGDRNIIFRNSKAPMFRSGDGLYDCPEKLFQALRGYDAMVVPHHTAYIGNHCDWSKHDPDIERLVEIYSVWGSSEMALADGNPYPIRNYNWNHPDYVSTWTTCREQARQLHEDACSKGFVQNALQEGLRLGFVGGGDMHYSWPGDHVKCGYPPTDYTAGLTAVWCRANDRDAIWQGLYNRRCYATTGARIIVDFRVAGVLMGSEISLSHAPFLKENREIYVEVHGTSKLDAVELVRNGKVIRTLEADGKDLVTRELDTVPFFQVCQEPTRWCTHPFLYYYLRVRQADGHMCWVSPIWIS